MWIELYPDELSVVACMLGGFIICFGLVSYFVKERLRLSEAMVSVIIGIILGPRILDILHPEKWGVEENILMGFTRMVIAVQVMFSGVALPKAYLIKEMKSLIVLLIPVMACMWIISGIAIWMIIPSITFLESLVLASCVTPTDPVLANSVVKGKFAEKHVPPHIRNLLSAESGANDGLTDQFLYLSLFLLQQPSFGWGVEKWILVALLYKILLSIVIGIAAGYIARKLLYFSEKNRLIDKESFLVFAIALALFLMGSVSIIGSNDLLACFIAGTSFTWDDWFRRETEEAKLQEIIDLLLNLAVFVFIGSLIPWTSFVDSISWWRLLLLSAVILLFRRLPAVFTLSKLGFIPAVKTNREALFTGWFGPIGVGAIYCAATVSVELEETDDSHANLRDIVQPVVFFLVFSSIMVHGFTVPLVMISKRINTRTITASSLNSQVSRLPMIRVGQEILFVSDDKKIDSLHTSSSEESSLHSNSPESTTIEIRTQGDDSEVTLSRIRDTHDLNLDQIRGDRPRQPCELYLNIPHDISRRLDPKSNKGRLKVNEKVMRSNHQHRLSSSRYAIWDEGDNYIVENYEGEDVRVIPSPSAHLRDHEGNSSEGKARMINFFKKHQRKSIENEKNKEKEETKDDRTKGEEDDDNKNQENED